MLNEQINQYITHLQDKRRVSPASLKNYSSTLRQYSESTGGAFPTSESVENWLSTIPHAPTANVKAVRLAGLAEFIGSPIKITRAKEPSKPIEALTSREVAKLIQWADPETGKVIAFLADTGLRFSEFIDLNEDSLSREDSQIGVSIVGKGSKTRWMPLSQRAYEIFQNMTFNMSEYHQTQLRKKMIAAGLSAGLEVHIHPHLLRASCASILMNERGAEAVDVARMLGHSNLSTLMNHYYKPSAKRLSGLVL